MRVLSVPTNVEFPELLLASMQILKMTLLQKLFLPSYHIF